MVIPSATTSARLGARVPPAPSLSGSLIGRNLLFPNHWRSAHKSSLPHHTPSSIPTPSPPPSARAPLPTQQPTSQPAETPVNGHSEHSEECAFLRITNAPPTNHLCPTTSSRPPRCASHSTQPSATSCPTHPAIPAQSPHSDPYAVRFDHNTYRLRESPKPF